MMSLVEYQKLAQRTASTKTMEAKRDHGILGLIGETGEIIEIVKKQKYMGLTDELFREMLIDEVGDVFWYVAEVCSGFGYDISALESALVIEEYEQGLFEDIKTCAICLIADAVQCAEDHRHGVSHFVNLNVVVKHLAFLLAMANIDLQDVLRRNIDKLCARYPEGFSSVHSNARYQR